MDCNGNGTLKVNHKNSSIEQHTGDAICYRGLWTAAGFCTMNAEYVVKGKSKKTAWQVYGQR